MVGIRVLRAARRAAVKARTQVVNQLRNLVVTAPEGLRRRLLRGLSTNVQLARRGHRPCGYAACGGRGQPREVKERSVLRQPLCGVSPVEASSGKVVRHRRNRGGNRDANRALHSICVVRMGRDRRTQAYVARRTAEGKSKREVMRCLKRYVAREVYRVLVSSAASPSPIES
jgi:hypothetical protein